MQTFEINRFQLKFGFKWINMEVHLVITVVNELTDFIQCYSCHAIIFD